MLARKGIFAKWFNSAGAQSAQRRQLQRIAQQDFLRILYRTLQIIRSDEVFHKISYLQLLVGVWLSIRKSNDHLYEGRYTPTNAYGKRKSHNIYAKTREECEEKLAEMIVQVKAQIKAEKENMTGWKLYNKNGHIEELMI